MAERRMFSKSVIGSARFLRMPPSSRLLYYDLGMAADDDGVVEAFSVMRMTGAVEDDLKVLVSKGFITVLNEDLVAYIEDWSKNNQIRKDRYQPSIYQNLLVQIGAVNQLETVGQPDGNQRLTQDKPIYKPYKDHFLVDKGKNIFDSINDIEIIKIQQNNGSVMAITWLGKTNYLGSIYDKSIKGIRLRKGNIQIGDGQTLNAVFKDARFNGWSIGEVFISSTQLIPNARRDNLEKTPAYFTLTEQLQKVATEITREIRAASLRRNRELSEALDKAKVSAQTAVDAIGNGINATDKNRISSDLTIARRSVLQSNVSDESGTYYQDIAFDELDMLIGKMKGITTFKAINTLEGLTNTEKRILEKVFTAILASNASNASAIIDQILLSFTKENKN